MCYICNIVHFPPHYTPFIWYMSQKTWYFGEVTHVVLNVILYNIVLPWDFIVSGQQFAVHYFFDTVSY